MDELYAAMVEDTVHCDLCGTSWALDGNDGGVILDAHISSPSGNLGQLKLCEDCSRRVHDAYRENLRDAGICEHGVNDGEYCEDCNKEYKRARSEHEAESRLACDKCGHEPIKPFGAGDPCESMFCHHGGIYRPCRRG